MAPKPPTMSQGKNQADPTPERAKVSFAAWQDKVISQGQTTGAPSPTPAVLKAAYAKWVRAPGPASDVSSSTSEVFGPAGAAGTKAAVAVEAKGEKHDKDLAAGKLTVAEAQAQLDSANAALKNPGAYQSPGAVAKAQAAVADAQKTLDWAKAQKAVNSAVKKKDPLAPLLAATGGGLQNFKTASNGTLNEGAVRQLMGTMEDTGSGQSGKTFDPNDPKSVARFQTVLQQDASTAAKPTAALTSYLSLIDQTHQNYGLPGSGADAAPTAGSDMAGVTTERSRKITLDVPGREIQAAQSLWGDSSGKRISQVMRDATVITNGNDPNAWKLAAGVLAADNGWGPSTGNQTFTPSGAPRAPRPDGRTETQQTHTQVADLFAKVKKYGSQVLAAIAHKYGDAAADYTRQNGRLPDALQVQGSEYLATAMSAVADDGQGKELATGLNGHDPRATAELQAILKPGAPLVQADPQIIKTTATNYVNQLLLRPASPGEIDGMTSAVQAAIMDAQRKNQPNVFADYGGGSGTPSTSTAMPDQSSMIESAIKASPEYKKLYAHMQAGAGTGTGIGFGADEAAYQKLYQNAAQSVLGTYQPAPNDAVRAGMEGGDPAAFESQLQGTSAAMAPQASFRENLFKTAALFNGLL